MRNPTKKHSEQQFLEEYIASTADLYQVSSVEQKGKWVARFSNHLHDLLTTQEIQCSDDQIGPFFFGDKLPQINISDDLKKKSALAKLIRNIREGVTDPVAHVEDCLAAIGQHSHLNAFQHVDAQGARDAAKNIRQRILEGKPVGALAGVTVAVKDCLDVKGMPISCGTRSWKSVVPDTDATIVERLRQADAIIIGITTMHELAYGATTDNPHQGRVRNPFDQSLIAGGSSGGSAVAVATGMADIALGTDSAGSVRMPASLCGITGYKPSYGLLPCTGMLPLAWTLDHPGLIAKSPKDVAVVLDVILRPQHASEAKSLTNGSSGEPKLLTALIPDNYFFDVIDPEVRQVFDSHVSRLEHAGVSIRRIEVELLNAAPILQFLTLCAEATQYHMNKALLCPDGLGEEVRVRLEMGQFLRAVDYIKAQRLRVLLRKEFMTHLSASSAFILTPTVILPASKSEPTVAIDNKTLPIHPAFTRATLPFNLTGLPAISVPSGVTAKGLPVGLQIATSFGEDAQLLSVAQFIEEC